MRVVLKLHGPSLSYPKKVRNDGKTAASTGKPLPRIAP